MAEHADENRYPANLEHQHGLSEWWPMLPERSAETIEPGTGPTERLYRCQAVGCGHMVRIPASSLGSTEEVRPS